MSQQGGGPPMPGYDPNIQGGAHNQPQAANPKNIGGGKNALFGGLEDTQGVLPGAGIAAVMGTSNKPILQSNVTFTSQSQKSGSPLGAFGFEKKRAQFDSNIQSIAEGIQEAPVDTSGGGEGASSGGAVEAARPIVNAGGQIVGAIGEDQLTGAGAIQAPAIGKGEGKGRDAGMGVG